MYAEVSKEFVAKLLNTLEVIEAGDGDSPYVLVEDNAEFRAVCRALKIPNYEIVSVSGGDDVVDLLALAATTYEISEYDDAHGFVVG
jgi:hypothetical protein